MKSLKTSIFLAALSGLLLLGYQNCTSYNDPSLFEKQDDGLASQSSPDAIRLDSPAGVIDVPAAMNFGTFVALSFGGECNSGLSSKHYIEVRVFDQNNTPISVRQDNLCPLNTAGLSADCFRANYFKCEHGKYYVHLPLNCGYFRGGVQGVYRLTGQMVTIDETGKENRDIKAAFDRFLSITWPPGCE